MICIDLFQMRKVLHEEIILFIRLGGQFFEAVIQFIGIGRLDLTIKPHTDPVVLQAVPAVEQLVVLLQQPAHHGYTWLRHARDTHLRRNGSPITMPAHHFGALVDRKIQQLALPFRMHVFGMIVPQVDEKSVYALLVFFLFEEIIGYRPLADFRRGFVIV